MNAIKRTDSIFLLFRDGKVVRDTNLQIKTYESREAYELRKQRCPRVYTADEELVEYVPARHE